MLEGLSNKAKKEVRDVIKAIDASDFVFANFDQWLKSNGFQVHDVGKVFTYRGSFGYVHFQFAILGGISTVVRCIYNPHSDTTKAYYIVTEGVSASGKSLSNKKLELLKLHRNKQVEKKVIATIGEQIGQLVRPQEKLSDDLGLDEEFDIPEIVMKLEDEFDCIITDDEAKSFVTVQDVDPFIRKAKGIST